MGTNYYLVYPQMVDVDCHTCGHSHKEQKKYHLGKSSFGWCFSLHVEPSAGINTWYDLYHDILTVVTANGGHIEDEYGETLTLEEFTPKVTERKSSHNFDERDWKDMLYFDEQNFHRLNHSERGPNNLLRHRVDGVYCIGHGEGTWDYITGEFS